MAELMPAQAAVCDSRFFLDDFRLCAEDRLLFGGRADSTGAAPAQLAEAMASRAFSWRPRVAQARTGDRDDVPPCHGDVLEDR